MARKPARQDVYTTNEMWQQAARNAFKRLDELEGDGAQGRCARDIRCSPGLVSHIVNGVVRTSKFVGPISDWLHIAPPTIDIPDKDFEDLAELLKQLPPEDRADLHRVVRRMVAAVEREVDEDEDDRDDDNRA